MRLEGQHRFGSGLTHQIEVAQLSLCRLDTHWSSCSKSHTLSAPPLCCRCQLRMKPKSTRWSCNSWEGTIVQTWRRTQSGQPRLAMFVWSLILLGLKLGCSGPSYIFQRRTAGWVIAWASAKVVPTGLKRRRPRWFKFSATTGSTLSFPGFVSIFWDPCNMSSQGSNLTSTAFLYLFELRLMNIHH